MLAASYSPLTVGSFGADVPTHLPIPVQLTCKSARGRVGLIYCRSGSENKRRISQHRDNKMRSGHVISLGTSPLLPSGREPPFAVTKATRGERVGRCSAHAQCSYLKGTFFWCLLSKIQTIFRGSLRICTITRQNKSSLSLIK